MNLLLETFEMKNIPHILDVVVPLWSPSLGDAEFKRFNVEYIVRNNIFENDYRFQLVERDEEIAAGGGNICANGDQIPAPRKNSSCASKNSLFLAAAFFARKTDASLAEEWFARESIRFPNEFKTASALSRDYLTMMDERTFALMNDDDIKLSLFVSCKPGAGSKILERCCEQLRREGWKNLFLWTDCECNWGWYLSHGFTLVQEDTYEPFSTEAEKYKMYIFKRKL